MVNGIVMSGGLGPCWCTSDLNHETVTKNRSIDEEVIEFSVQEVKDDMLSCASFTGDSVSRYCLLILIWGMLCIFAEETNTQRTTQSSSMARARDLEQLIHYKRQTRQL
jgi:hypothetical protein